MKIYGCEYCGQAPTLQPYSGNGGRLRTAASCTCGFVHGGFLSADSIASFVSARDCEFDSWTNDYLKEGPISENDSLDSLSSKADLIG